MKFDLTEVEFSINDKKRGIKIPEKLTEDLAELIGIIVGDGHVGYYESKSSGYKHYQTSISGNLDDLDYYENYVKKMFFKLFNVNLRTYIQKNKNCVELRIESKAIYTFFSKIIGIPQRKDNVSVPNCIKTGDRKVKKTFMRGLADADFCFSLKYKPNPYPVVQGTSKSKNLMKDCAEILKELKINSYLRREEDYYDKRRKIYVRFRLYLNGFSRSKKFMDSIGFANANKIKKADSFILL